MVHSVELLFDAEADAAVRRLWDDLTDAGVRSLASSTSPSNRPHLTLTVAEHMDDGVNDSLRPLLGRLPFARPLLEAAFWAAGWGTVWAHRDGEGEDAVRAFYGLTEEEKLLGWLFVGRPPRAVAAEHTATRPTPGPRISYH